MDSAILDQLNNVEKEVNSEVIKSKRGRKKKTLPKINGEEENDMIKKKDRPITCVFYLVTLSNIKEKNTLKSKLMKWTAIILIYCQIDTNPF